MWAAREQLVGIDTEVADVVLEWTQANRGIFKKVALAQFQKATKGLEHVQAAAHGLARQGIEHDIDTFAIGQSQDVFGKFQAARIQHMVGTQQLHEGALFVRSSGGKNFCAHVAGQLDGCDAHAAGSAMDQHALARLHVGQLLQCVIHRQEHRGHRGCGFKRPALRHESHRISAGDDVAGKARGTKAHDGIALLQMRHTAANAADDAGKLQPQAGSSKTFFHRLIGQQAHEVHHVAKVQARGPGAHFDFMRLQRRGLLRQPQQVAQLARHQEIKLEACTLLCRLA